MKIGLYVHFPFCISKCIYCDFNSGVAPEQLRQEYLAALETSIRRRLCPLADRQIATIFFGGGTPTLYPAADLVGVLDTVRECAGVLEDAEITCEANPETVDAEKLRAMRSGGFTRLSLGVQSLDDSELRLLGRAHTADRAREAVSAARQAFDNISVDLIYGIPGQTSDTWAATLGEIIGLQPDHVSAYGLMIEEETPLYEMVEAGEAVPLDDEAHICFYEQAGEMLRGAGFSHYEISNYAREGRQCRHNLIYWRNQEYLGCGAGAASYIDGERSSNIADPRTYINAVNGEWPVIAEAEHLDGRARAGESIMLALRTAEGADLRAISADCRVDIEAGHAELLAWLVEEGIATYTDCILRLTPERGWLLHSEVARRFLV